MIDRSRDIHVPPHRRASIDVAPLTAASFTSFYRRRNAIVILDTDKGKPENPSASNAARRDTDRMSLRDNLS